MDETPKIRLLIAEDQPMIRKALGALMASFADFLVVGAVADGAEAVRAAKAFKPHVILMDLKMPLLDGVSATRAILAENPEIRVIVLTTFEQDDLVFQAIMAGASAYLLKDAEEGEIVEAIRAAARGELRLAPRVAEKILSEFRRVKSVERAEPTLEKNLLTDRERDVLAGVASGKGNKDIARELNLAEGTVKNHVSTILSKLHLRSRTELAVRAVGNR